eukprot:tig00000361_g24393.t1
MELSSEAVLMRAPEFTPDPAAAERELVPGPRQEREPKARSGCRSDPLHIWALILAPYQVVKAVVEAKKAYRFFVLENLKFGHHLVLQPPSSTSWDGDLHLQVIESVRF